MSPAYYDGDHSVPIYRENKQININAYNVTRRVPRPRRSVNKRLSPQKTTITARISFGLDRVDMASTVMFRF